MKGSRLAMATSLLRPHKFEKQSKLIKMAHGGRRKGAGRKAGVPNVARTPIDYSDFKSGSSLPSSVSPVVKGPVYVKVATGGSSRLTISPPPMCRRPRSRGAPRKACFSCHSSGPATVRKMLLWTVSSTMRPFSAGLIAPEPAPITIVF